MAHHYFVSPPTIIEYIPDIWIVWYDIILDKIYITPSGENDDGDDSLYIGRL